MKKIYWIILLLFLAACNRVDNVKIGLLIESFNADRWKSDQRFFEEEIKKLGGEVVTKLSDGNEETQYNQAMELLEEGVDVIVIVANNVNSAAGIVRKAHADNVKVIAYDRLIQNCNLDYFVGFDFVYVGKLQAQYALEHVPRGNFIILAGDKKDINAVKIGEGQESEYLTKVQNGNVNVLYKVFIDGWSPKEAFYETEKVIKLSTRPIHAIIAMNDGMAGGAISALKKYNLLEDVCITGLDAEIKACHRILNGEQSMTVYLPIKETAHSAAKLAYEVASKAKPSFSFTTMHNNRIDVPSIIIKPLALDKNTINRVVEDGFHSKEDVFTKSN